MTKKPKKMLVPSDIPQLLQPGKRILLPGKIMFKPYGTRIWRKRIKAIVSADKFAKYVDIPIYLIEEDKALGIIRLKPAKEIDLKKFRKLRKFHKISDKNRKKWWPFEKTLYYYKVEFISKFDPPKTIIRPKGSHSWLDSVVFKSIDIGNPAEFKNEDLLRGHDLIHSFWRRLEASSDNCIKYHILFRREILKRKLKHKIVDSLDMRAKEIYDRLKKEGYEVSFDREKGLVGIEKSETILKPYPKPEPFDIESYEDDMGSIRKKGKVQCPKCGEVRTIRRIDQYIKLNLTGLCKDCLGELMSGKNHGAYENGRWHQSNGYIGILASEVEPEFQCMKDSRGYIYEHRYIMGKKLGRPLDAWEQVHHLNGIKNDNRLENLELVGEGEHLLITKIQKRIRELEEIVSKPYPSVHSCRLQSPGKYDRFARKNCAAKHDGKCIDHIYGILSPKKSELQSMRYGKDVWSAGSARSHCKSKGGSFEAATGKTKKLSEEKATRWNLSLSKNFDVEEVESMPASFEYDMASRFLDCEVKKIYQNDYFIPSPMMGTHLAGFKKILSEFELCDCRNFTYNGREVPLAYETIKLNSKNSDDFIIEGTSFYRVNGKNKLIVKFQPSMFGINAHLLSTSEERDWNKELLGKINKWAKENNFLKGEIFGLSGEFLEKTANTYDDLILDEEILDCIIKAVNQLNDKKERALSRGLMFVGKPGTGKTLTGKVLMSTLKDATFIWISSRDFHKVGSNTALKLGFSLARDLAPSVLFMEDIDTWLKDYSIDLLKTEMDGLKENNGMITILTSNNPQEFPDALLDRPGRFHDVLDFALPTKKMRKEMIVKWVKEEIEDDLMESILNETDGYSGAHIRELVDFANMVKNDDGINMGKSLLKSLKKLKRQKELINRIKRETESDEKRLEDRKSVTLDP